MSPLEEAGRDGRLCFQLRGDCIKWAIVSFCEVIFMSFFVPVSICEVYI